MTEAEEDVLYFGATVITLPFGGKFAVAATTLRSVNVLAIKTLASMRHASTTVSAKTYSLYLQGTYVTRGITVNPTSQQAIADFATGAVLTGPMQQSGMGYFGAFVGVGSQWAFQNSGP